MIIRIFVATIVASMIAAQARPARAADAVAASASTSPPSAPKVDAVAFRPPAVPLVTFDPYLSIWSPADRLTDHATVHWTKHPHPLTSLIRVDGKAMRLMGDEPKDVPAMPQVALRVWPTRSVYDFDDARVHVTMTFMTAALPDNLEVFSRPLSYITWTVRSTDGAAHDVSIYDGVSSQVVVNSPDQKVEWARETAGDLTALRVGTQAQPVLRRMGDDTRIDWGYAYLVAPSAQATASIAASRELQQSFVTSGKLPAKDDAPTPRAVNENEPAMGVAFDLGKVTAEPVLRHVIVAYDEIYAIKYFGQRLRPYWRRNGATPADMLQSAEKDYPQLVARCEAFDKELVDDLTKVGGARYAQIAALAYRQSLAACGLAADSNGQPLYFTKENTSNGDIATVDVIYPMHPILLLVAPSLAKASLAPVFTYAASPRWRFPNAPHDLGTYPNARGTDDGGEGMPVEESGNMILLCDAIAKIDGNADFVTPWWPKITQWAQYLEQYGLDPENQLCTDDFMGHLAHNANLSVKAILALAAYGDLCQMRGDDANAAKYKQLAKTDAEHWMKVAAEGDHSRLAFDKPGTWSQKYNLVWDRILKLNVFPPQVARQEVAFYKGKVNPFGVPLDSRTRLTKTDWSIWTATLADDQADFEALVSPIYDYLNATNKRVGLADSYETDKLNSTGMHARPVVGGIFIKMLADEGMWKKWSSRDKAKVGNWAPLPKPPTVTEVVPTSRNAPVTWRYTTQRPPQDWAAAAFNDHAWKEGRGAFGTPGTPGVEANTRWTSPDIWLRREITIPADVAASRDLQFLVYHDEDVQIFLGGIPAASEEGFGTSYEPLEIAPAAKALLKPGARLTLAVHCHQTTGGQGVDVGLATVTEPH